MLCRKPVLLFVGSLALLAGGVLLAPSAQPQESNSVEFCRYGHQGAGASRAVSIQKIDREYDRLERKIKGSIQKQLRRQLRSSLISKPRPFSHDAGLPACRRHEIRTKKLPRPLPKNLRGMSFVFFDAKSARALLTHGFPRNARLFAVRVSSARQLTQARTLLGEYVAVAPKRLAEDFGVRCRNALVTISPDGESASIEEGGW